jgi:hypothetical protein
MKQTSRLIAELLRAAIDPRRHSVLYVPELLKQSIDLIRVLRNTVGMPKEGIPGDIIPGLRAVAMTDEQLDPSELSGALLEAAEALNSLQVLIDGGYSVRPSDSGQNRNPAYAVNEGGRRRVNVSL